MLLKQFYNNVVFPDVNLNELHPDQHEDDVVAVVVKQKKSFLSRGKKLFSAGKKSNTHKGDNVRDTTSVVTSGDVVKDSTTTKKKKKSNTSGTSRRKHFLLFDTNKPKVILSINSVS